MTPEVAMRNPLPSAVHVIPVAADWQRNGPTPVALPYASVGVSSPAFPRHCSPVQVEYFPLAPMVTDRAGFAV
jgi:hypothetical protein